MQKNKMNTFFFGRSYWFIELSPNIFHPKLNQCCVHSHEVWLSCLVTSDGFTCLIYHSTVTKILDSEKSLF